MRLRKLVKSNVSMLKAYEAKAVPCTIKLDANESPFGISPEIVAMLCSGKNRKSFSSLNRYPDPQAKKLIEAVSGFFHVPSENILQGNGSDELIYYLILSFGGPVMYPVPTFSMYGVITQALDEVKIEIPLDSRFDLDLDKIIKAMKKKKPKLIFLSSPNNPTGNSFSFEKILRIIEEGSKSAVVVVDEAYQPFSGEKSFLSLIGEYPHLVVLKTLSKIGMAGLRVGFMIADKGIRREVNKVRLPFNLNTVSQMFAVEVLKRKKTLNSYIRKIIAERERLFNEMRRIPDIAAYPSDANFILFKVSRPERIYHKLLQEGLLIRNLEGIIEGYLRVTVGSPEENKTFLNALKKILPDQ